MLGHCPEKTNCAENNSNLLIAEVSRGRTEPPVVNEQAMNACVRLRGDRPMQGIFRLPDFSVVVWLLKNEKFAALKSEVLAAAGIEPYESTEYQGMVDFHWSASSFTEAKGLAEALKGAAQHRELVLLRIMSQVNGVDSISIKDDRRTKH
jgi:hypothetical protein